MSSTWIQMPVENAKEVAERYLNDLFNLDGLGAGNYIKENCTLSYESDCEVYLTVTDISNNVRPQYGYVYFGYLYVNCDNSLETAGVLSLNTGSDSKSIIDCATQSVNSIVVPIIFNEGAQPFDHTNSYFIGYKFIITNP